VISFNTIYQFIDDNERIRIIHVDHENDLCAYVHINGTVSMPIIEKISVIDKEYDNNRLVEVIDPYYKIRSESNLSEIEIKKRDDAWYIVEKYWETRKNEILTKKTRMKVFQEIATIENISLMAVKRVFSRLWQRGLSKNSLLPDYAKSGGKGKQKDVKDKKMGRRRVYGEDDTEGVIINDAIRKQFQVATNKYYRTSQKKPLRQVYRLMLADFYSVTVQESSQIEKIIRSSDSIPSFQQYYYWFKKNEDTALDIKSRDGAKEYELKHRPLLGNSTLEAPGPGFRFQIDATTADIYIVSELERSQIIGRPTVYILVDVFSRMITGVYVGLESPSWNGAMMVLDSMVADKVELCKKHNITIESEDWPCSYIPEAIIADRGEMEGYGVENLINNLNITIENTSPYRGDLKGIVERFFRTINERIESFLPGAVMKDYRKRGDPDYRLEAKLTLKEINEIVLRTALLRKIREIEKYPLAPEMIRDEVLPTPLDIWNWGIRNKKGTLRKIDRDRFRMNILPRGKATISRGAVIFRNLHYGATELLDDALSKRMKLKSIGIVYDPRNMEHIYWLKEDGMSYLTFNLLDRSGDFKGMFLEDVISAGQKAAKLRQTARKSQLQQETELDQTILRITKEATQKTNREIDSTVSNTQRLKDIRSNRAQEKERNRRDEAFAPQINPKDNPASVITFQDIKPQTSLQNDSKVEDVDYNSRMMDKIRRRKEELRNDKNET